MLKVRHDHCQEIGNTLKQLQSENIVFQRTIFTLSIQTEKIHQDAVQHTTLKPTTAEKTSTA